MQRHSYTDAAQSKPDGSEQISVEKVPSVYNALTGHQVGNTRPIKCSERRPFGEQYDNIRVLHGLVGIRNDCDAIGDARNVLRHNWIVCRQFTSLTSKL